MKELAEFVAEFLGKTVTTQLGVIVLVKEETLFHDDTLSPYLAQLAKREMEKRGWYWHLKNYASGYRCYMNKGIDAGHFAEHENEFVALWTAIREATQ